MGFVMIEAKEVLSLQMSRNHDKKCSSFISFYFLPNVIVVKREKGSKRGEGQT
jgi:hypothetical protein